MWEVWNACAEQMKRRGTEGGHVGLNIGVYGSGIFKLKTTATSVTESILSLSQIDSHKFSNWSFSSSKALVVKALYKSGTVLSTTFCICCLQAVVLRLLLSRRFMQIKLIIWWSTLGGMGRQGAQNKRTSVRKVQHQAQILNRIVYSMGPTHVIKTAVAIVQSEILDCMVSFHKCSSKNWHQSFRQPHIWFSKRRFANVFKTAQKRCISFPKLYNTQFLSFIFTDDLFLSSFQAFFLIQNSLLFIYTCHAKIFATYKT